MNKIVERLKKDLSYGESFDITFREVINEKHHFWVIFLNFLINSSSVTNIIYSLNHFLDEEQLLSKVLLNEGVKTTTDYDLVYTSVLNGDVVIIVDESSEVLFCETKNYPNRSVSEPDSEKVVRGSRDGFTENFATNIALIRRRIKSGKLKTILIEVGKISKTNVALVYLDGYVNDKYLNDVKARLKEIDVDEITMADKQIEEFILKDKFTPYPLVKYTERPDTFCSHLYQGMFGIIVDTSPSVILGPVSIFDHMQHAEEFRQTMFAGSYLRLIRLIGIILSFLIVPLWYVLLQYDTENFKFFSKFFDVEFNNFTIFIQLLIMELSIEFLRMASIHTPNALSTSMGIIAGVIIGEMAINLGIITEQIVLLGAISAIGSFITPSYELSLANKITKLFIVLSIFLFGIYGFIGSLIILILYLASLKSFGRSYLYPLIPFNFKDLIKQLIRPPFVKKHKKNIKQ